jgi:hypothetical protein
VSINQTSDITKFFNEIIVTKDKVTRIKEYYTNIQTNLVNEFNKFKLRLESDIAWMQSQISYINTLFSGILTKVNSFTMKSTTDDLIVDHFKYKEMMDLYNSYINRYRG